MEINTRKSQNSAELRGQAFVVFREQDMADRGLAELKGFSLFGKPMVKLTYSLDGEIGHPVCSQGF